MGKKNKDLIVRHIGITITLGRDWKGSMINTLISWGIDFIPYGLVCGVVLIVRHFWGFEYAILTALFFIFYQITKGKYCQNE